MKLSSRKELLSEAGTKLKEIRKSLNEETLFNKMATNMMQTVIGGNDALRGYAAPIFKEMRNILDSYLSKGDSAKPSRNMKQAYRLLMSLTELSREIEVKIRSKSIKSSSDIDKIIREHIMLIMRTKGE
jgi:ABC-type ATPase with predicted acetyltransferase domain